MGTYGGNYGVLCRMNEKIWEQFDLSEIDRLVDRIIVQSRYNFSDVVRCMVQGEWNEVWDMLKHMIVELCIPGLWDSKNLWMGLILLGLFSMILHYSFGVVKSRQVSEIAYYIVYLLLILLLLDSFGQMLETGRELLDLLKQFIAALVPAYCLSVSLSIGSASAVVHYELVILLLLGIDYILVGMLLPVTQSYVFLVIVDGIDESCRLKEFVRLLERAISWGIKVCLTITVVVSGIQNAVSVQLDGMQKTVFQKAVGALPGIGDLSESVTQVLAGSASLIKNGIGATAMIFLFLIVLRPLWEVFCMAMSMRLAAAFIRVMGQSRLSDTIAKMGEAGILVMRIVTCAVIAFYISIAMTMFVMKGAT